MSIQPPRRWLPAVALLGTVGVACSSRFGAPDPASSQGNDVLGLWRVLIVTGIAVGGFVVALLVITLVRDRQRRSPLGGLPPQTRENIPLEIAYTAVPLLIVAALFALTIRMQRPVTRLVASPGLLVEATAFQWGWRFAYPDHNVTAFGDSNTPPTLVLPLGITTRVVLESPDVIHSFSVPAFLVKRDAIPGANQALDITPTRAGTFPGYCAEFCGLDHARMTFSVEVVTQQRFQQWVDQQRPQPSGDPGDPGPGTQGDPGGQALGDSDGAGPGRGGARR